jgi:ElaB/YqjD/DUF883 family membrane-anchored ribosome-binding protein
MRTRWALGILAASAFTLLIVGLFGLALAHVGGAVAHFVQNTPDVVVPPSSLDRLSWGSVIAGAIIAIIVQLAMNLLGLSIGMTSINPEYDDGAKPKELATGAAIWVGFSTLLALFAGGWIAARFAGIPDNTDGLLHGLMVWGVVVLVSVFFLTTSVGRILSGVASLIGNGLSLAGSVTGAVTQGVASVAGSAASGMATAVGRAASNLADNVQDTVDSTPQLDQLRHRFDLSLGSLVDEARKTMQQAGIDPNMVQDKASDAARAVQETTEQVVQNPGQADQAINNALNRVFMSGQEVVNQADRDSLVRVVMERMNLNEDEARQMVSGWEERYRQIRMEFENAAHELQDKAEQIRQQAMDKVEEAKDEAARVARETAQATTKAIARLAAAVFAAIVIGAIAAGIGGLLGAPRSIPAADVTRSSTSTVYVLPH